MAPELMQSKGKHRKADIWSFGCLIVEMAVGGNLWGEQTFDNFVEAVVRIVSHGLLPKIPEHLS